MLLGREGLSGATADHVGGVFWRAFFFSVQTFATIGYGTIVAAGIAGNLLVTVEALIGLLAQALITGLLFARFARPTMALQFSTMAVIAPFNDGTALMFRVANRRRNELIELDAKVTLTMRNAGVDAGERRYYPLALDRRSVSFLPATWTLVHPITPGSPLSGMTASEVVWGAKFRNILNTTRSDGTASINLTKLDLYDVVDLPVPTTPLDPS